LEKILYLHFARAFEPVECTEFNGHEIEEKLDADVDRFGQDFGSMSFTAPGKVYDQWD
jgi:hypothetical protein